MDDKDFIDGLKKAGRLDSALLLRKFSELGLSGKETIIAQKRYVEGLSFKEILPYLNMEERSMYRCHKNLINKALDRAITDYLLSCGWR